MDISTSGTIECFILRSAVRSTGRMATVWALTVAGHLLLGHFLLALVWPMGPVLEWMILIVVPALIYGVAVAVCLRLYFRKGPQVVLDADGIEDRRQALGVIYWNDIRRLSINSLHDADFLSIKVDNPEKYLLRLNWWNRFGASSLVRKGFPAIAIGFGHLDPSLDEIWQFICEHHSHLT